MKIQKHKLKYLISELLETQDPYGSAVKLDSEDYVSSTNNPDYFKFKDSYTDTEEAFIKNAAATGLHVFEFMLLFVGAKIALTYGAAKLLYAIINARGTKKERERKVADAMLGLLPGRTGKLIGVANSLGVDTGTFEGFADADEEAQEKVAEELIKNLDKPENKKSTDRLNKKIEKEFPDAAEESAI